MKEATQLPVMRFTGSYDVLTQKGFQSQKMYAAEYPCYHDYKPEHESNHCLWIWLDRNEIEIDDWYGLSATILLYLNRKTFKNDLAHLRVNKSTHEVTELTRSNDSEQLYRKCIMTTKEEKLKEADDFYTNWHTIYRTYHINITQLNEELKLIEGMYEICHQVQEVL